MTDLECGCYLDEHGRTWCPSCSSASMTAKDINDLPPFWQGYIRALNNKIEWLETELKAVKAKAKS